MSKYHIVGNHVWLLNYEIMINHRLIQKVLSEGVQLWQSFFSVAEGREDPNTTISGSSSARQQNAIKMAFRGRADDGIILNVGFVIFSGSERVLLRNPIFLWFFREGSGHPATPPPPSGSAVVMGGTMGTGTFKPEKNLVFFRLKSPGPHRCHPGKLEWLAVNNLVYFRGILVGPMIVIVFWTVEINLVYFAQKRRLICDCDSFLGCWD